MPWQAPSTNSSKSKIKAQVEPLAKHLTHSISVISADTSKSSTGCKWFLSSPSWQLSARGCTKNKKPAAAFASVRRSLSLLQKSCLEQWEKALQQTGKGLRSVSVWRYGSHRLRFLDSSAAWHKHEKLPGEALSETWTSNGPFEAPQERKH